MTFRIHCSPVRISVLRVDSPNQGQNLTNPNPYHGQSSHSTCQKLTNHQAKSKTPSETLNQEVNTKIPSQNLNNLQGKTKIPSENITNHQESTEVPSQNLTNHEEKLDLPSETLKKHQNLTNSPPSPNRYRLLKPFGLWNISSRISRKFRKSPMALEKTRKVFDSSTISDIEETSATTRKHFKETLFTRKRFRVLSETTTTTITESSFKEKFESTENSPGQVRSCL
uniref:Uncharacterized protein n=1 Tax=Cacopsylla melanoneura TaxID=428564 RepID=A0A8D8ZBV3_9HEMI